MPHTPWKDGLRRLLALSCAALVLALGVFAANPALHQQLHRNGGQPTDDGCAIVLFAHGVSVPLAMDAPPPLVAAWQRETFLCVPGIFLGSPRYLFQPEHGPPAA